MGSLESLASVVDGATAPDVMGDFAGDVVVGELGELVEQLEATTAIVAAAATQKRPIDDFAGNERMRSRPLSHVKVGAQRRANDIAGRGVLCFGALFERSS
jgi:hypothetical protein